MASPFSKQLGCQVASLSGNGTERIHEFNKGASTHWEGRGSVVEEPRTDRVQVSTNGVWAPPLSSCVSVAVAHGEKEARLSHTPQFPNLFISTLVTTATLIELLVHVRTVLSLHMR